MAADTVGYNVDCEFIPDLSVTYELLDDGPDHIYYGQYLAARVEEYGDHIDPTKDNSLSKDERFWAMDKAYRIITVRKGDKVVFQMEGKRGFRNTEYVEGSWEKRIIQYAASNPERCGC